MGRFGVVAIDGTKIAGNASMRANRKFSRLKEKAAEVLERSAAVDAAEDVRHGEKGTRLDLLPLWTDPQARPELISDALAEISVTDEDPIGADSTGTDDIADHHEDQHPPEEANSTSSAEVAVPASSTEVAVVAGPSSTEVALRPSVQVVVSARAARFAADKDARVLAAFHSVAAQEAARDAAVREPRVVKALARVARAHDRSARIRARLEA